MRLFKFKPKRTLKDVCVELYGEEYGKQYDILASGRTIGDLQATIEFIEKLELAREVSEDAGRKLKGRK
jgi:hypothetical protein